MRSSRQVLFGLLAATAHAVGIQHELSFGQSGQHVWSDDHRHVEGFTLSGDHGHHPELLSDRIILTSPWPGNQRAAIWANKPEPDNDWAVSTEFRASGPDNGGGNLNLWYVNRASDVGTSSLYTVGKFDGMVLVVDQFGHKAGAIRAFLNDGSKDFKNHHHLDNLAFGHCDYKYRNTGHMVHLEIRHTANDGLEVLVDGHHCFSSKKIKLPTHSFFGITASSAETPDSIEIRNFIAVGPTTGSAGQRHLETRDPHQYDVHANDHKNYQVHEQAAHHRDPHDKYADKDWYWDENHKDTHASDYTSEKERFQELHDKTQMTIHQLDVLFHDLTVLKEEVDTKHQELISWLAPIHDYVTQSKALIERIDAQVEGQEFKDLLHQLSMIVSESHHTLLNGIPMAVHSSVTTRMGFFLFVLVAFQVMCLGSYLVYMRRKDRQTKKYL